jgi:hypothetical protein
MNFLDEVAEHRLGDFKISNDAVLQRANGDDASRSAAQHSFSFGAHSKDLFTATLISLLNRDNRGLITHDPLVLHIDQGVGGPKINGKIVGKNAKEGIEHHKTPSNLREKGLKQRENNRFGLSWQGNEKIKEKRRPAGGQWLQLDGPFPIMEK